MKPYNFQVLYQVFYQEVRLYILNKYVTLRADILKFFTVDPIFKEQAYYFVWITDKNSIFRNNKRLIHYRPDEIDGVFISFHYPGQLLLTSNPWDVRWEYRPNKTQEYLMLYSIKYLADVRKCRNYESHCIEEHNNYDHVFIDSTMKKIAQFPINSAFGT